MDEVGELERVADEEHRRIVADQIPVAFFGVELDGKTTHVALGICCSPFTGHGGKAHEKRGLLAWLGEQGGLGVAGDVTRDGEGAERTRALGMHAALGDHFAVEMGQLFQEPHVLQQHRATGAGSQAVLVVGHRCAGLGSELGAIHGKAPCME